MLQIKIIECDAFELTDVFNTRINDFLARIDALDYSLEHIEYFKTKNGYVRSVVIAYEVGGVKDE